MNEEYSNYKKIIKGFRIALFTTINSEGMLHSRPMAIARAQEDEESIWLFTLDSSAKSQEVKMNPKSSIACMDNTMTLTIAGNSVIVQDTDMIRDFWKDEFNAWFPQGVDTAHLALIRFDPTEAQYWCYDANHGLKYLVNSVKAVTTGTELPSPCQQGHVIL